MKIPPLPPPPSAIRPTCERCSKRGEHARRVAAGHGTVQEIREAQAILEAERRSGIPLGQTVRVDGAWVCPRCANAGTKGEPRPLLEVAPNRKARRKTRIR